MTKRKELTDFECGEIVGLGKGNFTQIKIAEILGHPRTTVGNIIRNYREQGLASRSGRPKITSEQDNKHIVKIAKINRNNTLEEIAENFNIAMSVPISKRIVQRILHKEDYSRHAAKKKPFISKIN